VLADCSQHFADELLGRRFGREHVKAAHHHFDMTACQLFGCAQSLLRTVTLNGNSYKVRR
jgi:hypothetical protein